MRFPLLVRRNQPRRASAVPAYYIPSIAAGVASMPLLPRFAGRGGMGNGTKYLIGGAPAVGKSTIAAKLAAHLDLPWTLNFQIRGIMRTVATRHDHPKLFNLEGYDAESFYGTFSAADRGDRAQLAHPL